MSQSTVLNFLFAPFLVLTKNRHLLKRLVMRELDSRYRGSILGMFWLVIQPILMLAIYTFVFSVVFQARWGEEMSSKADFALIVFSGLIVYNLFAEVVGRAPGIILENTSYIKKVVFPLELLAWVSIGVAIFNAVISLAVLLIAQFFIKGVIPITALLLPIFLLPVVLQSLGLSWWLSSVGVYLRDTKPIVGVLLTVTMFLSPIFYPVSAVPQGLQSFLYVNPLSLALEGSKTALFGLGQMNWLYFGLYCAVSLFMALLGYLWFMKTRKGFADVT